MTDQSPNTNICLSDASILNEPITSATDYIDATPVEVFRDHSAVNYIDNKQLPTSNMHLIPEELQIELSDINSVLPKGFIQIEVNVLFSFFAIRVFHRFFFSKNNSAIDGTLFDKYGQTIELITTDGRKLRLLTPYPDQQLDLSELIIS